MASGCFDIFARDYDRTWTNSGPGRLQRDASWREILPLFRPSEKVLDLGCGTGEDARALQARGVHVDAVDASREMVQIARSRGVNAECKAIEEIESFSGIYDGVISNFGALNCIADMAILRAPLARLVRPEGRLVLCLMSRFCLFETLHYLRKFEPAKAVRRWRGQTHSKSLNLDVFYPAASTIQKALSPSFRLLRRSSAGLFVPPSYVDIISASSLSVRSQLDCYFGHWPLLRSLADHQLFVFVRQ